MAKKDEIELKQTKELLDELGLQSYKLLINPAPEPDFTLITDGLNIGIEHTRLYLSKDLKGIDLTKHTKATERIMVTARRIFERKQSEKLTVSVHFRNSYGLGGTVHMLTMKDVTRLSEIISEFVIHHIPRYGEQLRFNCVDFKINSIILPPEIVSISIWNKYSHWTTQRGGLVPNIQGDALLNAINKKNSKVINYTGIYDEIWLLLVEDQEIDTCFDFENVDNIMASSYFNKVFVLRYGMNKAYQLGNTMPPEVRWQSKHNN